jgi:hypothetical protein
VLFSGAAGLTDVVSAVQAQLEVKCDTNSGRITVTRQKTPFKLVGKLNPDSDLINCFVESGIEPTAELLAFTSGQILDPSGLLDRWKKGADRLSQQLWANLHAEDRALQGEQPRMNDANPTGKICEALNAVLKGRRLPAPANLAQCISTNLNEQLYNRLVLEGIFDGKLAPFRLTIPGFAGDSQSKKDAFQSAKVIAERFYSNMFSLNLRTVEATMFTVAADEVYFRSFLTNSKGYSTYADRAIYSSDADGPFLYVSRPYNGTMIKVRPLMTMTRDEKCGERPPENRTVWVDYTNPATRKKKRYYVGDVGDSVQNRTVFTFLSYLMAQTAVSTQNLPVQQTIRLQ